MVPDGCGVLSPGSTGDDSNQRLEQLLMKCLLRSDEPITAAGELATYQGKQSASSTTVPASPEMTIKVQESKGGQMRDKYMCVQ